MFNAVCFKFQGRKGFTFIEMLIVVAIIGILASIILVGLGSFRNRGRDTRRIADLREVQNGLELYYEKNGFYPGANSDPSGAVVNWSDLTGRLINAGIGINALPNDPATGWSYGYCVSGNSYAVGTYLEDSNNSNLTQYQASTVFPCNPSAVSGTRNEDCSKVGSITSKYCVIF